MDIVDVVDVEDSLRRFGDRYLQGVYTPQEIAACADGTDARRLATHFAAKEAALKSLPIDSSDVDLRSGQRCVVDDETEIVERRVEHRPVGAANDMTPVPTVSADRPGQPSTPLALKKTTANDPSAKAEISRASACLMSTPGNRRNAAATISLV